MLRRERFNDPILTLLSVWDGQQANIWTAMPAIVESFDPAKMTVKATVAIKIQRRKPDQSTEWVTISTLADCPVVFPGGGGFALTFPIKQGDEALIIFANRCIDAWWQSGGIQQQAEFRMHNLSDGFALVGVRSVPRVPGSIHTDNVQLRSDDGLAFVEIAPSHNIKAKTTGDIFLESPGKIQLKAPLLEVIGDVTVTGGIVTGGDVVADGISADHHVHGGVTSGGSLTAEPE